MQLGFCSGSLILKDQKIWHLFDGFFACKARSPLEGGTFFPRRGKYSTLIALTTVDGSRFIQ